MPTQSDEALRSKAQGVVRSFNAVVQSHRLLTTQQLDALVRGLPVTVRSGTLERPVLELTLKRAGDELVCSVLVDPTLPPRMAEHAKSLAKRFHESQGQKS